LIAKEVHDFIAFRGNETDGLISNRVDLLLHDVAGVRELLQRGVRAVLKAMSEMFAAIGKLRAEVLSKLLELIDGVLLG